MHKILLKQVRAWFIRIALTTNVMCACVCVCMCVSVPKANDN